MNTHIYNDCHGVRLMVAESHRKKHALCILTGKLSMRRRTNHEIITVNPEYIFTKEKINTWLRVRNKILRYNQLRFTVAQAHNHENK